MDVRECDVVDVQSLAKYYDGYIYMLTVIDVFLKFLHIVPLRVKTRTAVDSAFLSSLGDKNIPNQYVYIVPGFQQRGAKSS
jgi:hypothetical protein